MEDIIVIVLLCAIVAGAAWYVIRAKKKGKKCIGCPEDGCSHNCACCQQKSK